MEAILYRIKRNDVGELSYCDFDAFIITNGVGAFEIIQDAELEDYLDI